MKKLKYDFLPVKKIIVPFPIESESLKKQPDLRAYYKYLFPHEAEFLSNKNPQIIAISLLPEVLLDFLFKDFKKAVLKILHTMMGPDYVQWHGFYDIAERFYMEMIAKAEKLLPGVTRDILERTEHKWFQEELSKKEQDSITAFYKQQYGTTK